MSSTDPIIIIGGGHNGLSAAASLTSQSRLPVLVLEARDHLGGITATESLIQGFQFNTGFSDLGAVSPAVIRKLDLERHGLVRLRPASALFAAGRGASAVSADHHVTGPAPVESERIHQGLVELETMAGLLAEMFPLPAPNLKQPVPPGEILPWGRLALKLRGRGKRGMMEFVRALPMSAREFLDERFPDGPVKTGLAVLSTHAALLGPYSAGSLLNLLYTLAGGLTPVYAQGGAGMLAQALAVAVKAGGGEIQTGVRVARILVRGDAAVGVMTEDGREIPASAVISSLDPAHTFFGLLEPGVLGVGFTRRLRSVRYRGSTATVHFALNRLPGFEADPGALDGRITLAESVEAVERAYDDAKYGRISTRPALVLSIPSLLDPTMAPAGRHSLTAVVRFAPFALRAGSYEGLADRVIAAISAAAPDFKDCVETHVTLTPADYRDRYGLTEGAWMHGQMALDQLLVMRPVPGWSEYRTPVDHLWLCGSGSHPGGGMTCAPGLNAAREFLSAA